MVGSEKQRKITIRDVARYAGTSYQTVSRVINGSESVAPETRERILKAINDLNYRPSVAARALNNSHTNVIAVATPFDSDNLFEDPNLLQIIHGIDREAARRDCSLLLSTLRSVDDPFSPYRRLLTRQLADGMIVSGETMEEEGIHRVIEQGYPVVIIGYNQLGVPCVHADDEGGAYQAVTHLLSLGHQKIAMITGPQHFLAIQARERGFANAFAAYGLDASAIIEAGDFSTRSGYDAMARLIPRVGKDFTAMFIHNDRMAIGAIHCLAEHGYSVPRDLSIVGFDDIPVASLQNPPLTTVHMHSMMLGQKATEILFSILDGNDLAAQALTLGTELVVRSTTAPLDS